MAQQDIIDELNYLNETKGLIKQAIINKGQTITAETPFRDYVGKINDIETGVDTSDATATADDILNPKTAYVNGEKITGNIIPTYVGSGFVLPYTYVNGNRTVVINNLPETTTKHFIIQDWDYNGWYILLTCIDENFSYYKIYNNKWWGYNSSDNRISDTSKYKMYKSNSQNPNVPWYFLENGNNTDANWVAWFGGSDSTCYNSDGTLFYDYPEQMTLISLQRNGTLYRDTADANAIVSDILLSKTAYVNGNKVTGTMPNNGALSYTPTTSQQTIPEGYTSGGTISAVDNTIDANITQNNIKAGVTILGVTGNLQEGVMTQEEYNIAVQTANNIYTSSLVNLWTNNIQMLEGSADITKTTTGFSYKRTDKNRYCVAGIILNNLDTNSYYTMSFKAVGNSSSQSWGYFSIMLMPSNSSIWTSLGYCLVGKASGDTITITFKPTTPTMKIGVNTDGDTYSTIELQYIMLEIGSNAHSYVPYTEDVNLQANLNAILADKQQNVLPSNIKAGATILGVQGNLEPDKPDQTKTCTPTTSQQIIEPDTGYELASVTVNAVTSAIDNNIQASNIKKDVTILGVTGTLESATPITDATAVAEDILKDKVAYNNNGKVIGTLDLDTSLNLLDYILEGGSVATEGELYTDGEVSDGAVSIDGDVSNNTIDLDGEEE